MSRLANHTGTAPSPEFNTHDDPYSSSINTADMNSKCYDGLWPSCRRAAREGCIVFCSPINCMMATFESISDFSAQDFEFYLTEEILLYDPQRKHHNLPNGL
jgi:hypothetical protein